VSWRRLIARIGVAIFAFGVLVLLFVAYQLWGTSITTRFHQEALRRQFDQELAAAGHHHTPHSQTTTSVSGPTTTTTEPTRGVATAPGVAPADGQPVGTIEIPAIAINFVVVQGTTTSDLELGPGHYDNSPLPGQPGNAAIAGHRTTYLHPFFDLDKLTAGDPIYITTTQGRFEYDVSTVTVVTPSDLAVLQPTAVPTLTLTTCNPRYSAAQRLVVQATLVTPPAPVPPKTTADPTPRGRATRPPVAELAGTNGSPWPATGWGVAAAGLAATIWLAMLLWRRWPARLALGFVGGLAFLALLFVFFQSVTPLLPASF